MQFTIKIQNRDEILSLFRRAPAIANKEFNQSLERVALKVVQDAQANSPVGKYRGGGNLRQSIKYIKNPGATGFLVYVNAEYGIFVDQGTRPHIIVPKNKAFLAFESDGGWVFTKRVRHPGSRATHFFENAVKSGEAYANTEFPMALSRVLNQL